MIDRGGHPWVSLMYALDFEVVEGNQAGGWRMLMTEELMINQDSDRWHPSCTVLHCTVITVTVTVLLYLTTYTCCTLLLRGRLRRG